MSSADASTESPRLSEGKLERAGPWVFALIGLAMIVIAAIDYLDASVSIAFVAIGAGLMVLGGLSARVEGPVKVGVQGFEMALRARKMLVEVQREVAKHDPEEAERVGEHVEQLDELLELHYLRAALERRRPVALWERPSVLFEAHRRYRESAAAKEQGAPEPDRSGAPAPTHDGTTSDASPDEPQ